MRATEYRRYAEDLMACAGRAVSEEERAEYVRLAKAWLVLAEGAEHGLQRDQARAEPEV